MCNEEKKIFNYMLSMTRSISEDVFGILLKRFSLYQRRLVMKTEHVSKVVLATFCLYQFLSRSAHICLLKYNNREWEGSYGPEKWCSTKFEERRRGIWRECVRRKGEVQKLLLS